MGWVEEGGLRGNQSDGGGRGRSRPAAVTFQPRRPDDGADKADPLGVSRELAYDLEVNIAT